MYVTTLSLRLDRARAAIYSRGILKEGLDMSLMAHSDLAELVGGWRLASFGATFSDTNQRSEPYGPDPDGRMVVEPRGRIMFLFTRSNRVPPSNDFERAVLFNEMTAYTGMVRLDGPGRLITTVDLAWNPAWQGEQLRFFTLTGDRLTIRTPPHAHPQFPARQVVADLVWTPP